MLPVDNARCNFTYTGPTADIGDLRVERTKDLCSGASVVRSFWRPSSEELQLLNDGGLVELDILGMEPIPPVALNVIPDVVEGSASVAFDV